MELRRFEHAEKKQAKGKSISWMYGSMEKSVSEEFHSRLLSTPDISARSCYKNQDDIILQAFKLSFKKNKNIGASPQSQQPLQDK